MARISEVSFKSDPSNLLTQAMNKPPVFQTKEQPQPSVKENESSKLSTEKIAYVSSAIAIASLGVASVIAIKHGKGLKDLTSSTRQVAEQLNSGARRMENIESSIGSINEALENGAKQLSAGFNALDSRINKSESHVQNLENNINGLRSAQEEQISKVRRDLEGRFEHLIKSNTSASGDVLVESVSINGKPYNLATVMHGYGPQTPELERTLRSESAKRIFQIVDRSNITPADNITVRIPTSEFKGLSSTGGMSIVPKEVIANLGAIINSKQNTRLIVDTPMYLGQVDDNVFYSLVRRPDGKGYDYISSKSTIPIANVEKLDTMEIPIYSEAGKTPEKVELYMARDMEQIIDLNLLMPWLKKDLAKEISTLIKSGEPFDRSFGILHIKYDPDKMINKPIATIKYDALLYKNEKFLMDGPLEFGKAKNIYNNMTHEAGETERFMYFDKFFYEYLFKNNETSAEKIGADVILGNDWQTGGISAMIRLLTQARKAFGLDPKVADKIYNTPIVTIMHNAGLAGAVDHSQGKLLNILFDEHAAMIAKNAWMPQRTNLPAHELNGLFHGDALNPQTMASVYSDVLVPVSKGYGHEMASHSGFGHGNHDIFRMRARYHEFSETGHIKYLALENNLDPNLVQETNLAYRPITNGCDKVNNKLNEATARKIERVLGLEDKSLALRKADESVYDWHNHNKEVYLRKVIDDINLARHGKSNPMNIALPEMTNLEGVTKDTMIVSTAGRIVDQKGLDIFAEAIEEFLERHKGEKNLPVFYVQGIGDTSYVDKLLAVKKRIAQKYGSEAANRIVYAKLFSEPGRYDGCKLMSDFTVMSSWFEPCGLVHKEIAPFSGAIPLVNKVGGLTDGLTDGINAIFSDFRPKFDNYEDALHFNRNAFADALDKAYGLFHDKTKFSEVLANSYHLDNSWLKLGGPMEEYARALVDIKVLKPEVLKHS